MRSTIQAFRQPRAFWWPLSPTVVNMEVVEKRMLESIHDRVKQNCSDPPAGKDPRYANNNNANKCVQYYVDFDRCKAKFGEGEKACTWFKAMSTTMCQKFLVERWENQKEKGAFTYNPAEEI